LNWNQRAAPQPSYSDAGRHEDADEQTQAAAELFDTASQVGPRKFTEWDMTVQEYKAKIDAELAVERKG